jgi:hypothetical protein
VTAPRVIATQVWAGQTAATRTATLTAGTAQGETVLAEVGSNSASIGVTGMTDTRGNQWTLDRIHTTGPYTVWFRLDGATGGPGGGPSAALAPGDSLIVATALIQAQMGILAITGPYGAALATPYEWGAETAGLSVTVPMLAPRGGDVVAMGLNQGSGGVAAFDPPLTTLISAATGHQYTAGYLTGAPGGLVTVTMRWQVSAAARLVVWTFVPTGARLPLRAWDGAGWRAVARAAA